MFDDVSISAGLNARFVAWQTVSAAFPMWGSQSYFLGLVAKKHDAHFYQGGGDLVVHGADGDYCTRPQKPKT